MSPRSRRREPWSRKRCNDSVPVCEGLLGSTLASCRRPGYFRILGADIQERRPRPAHESSGGIAVMLNIRWFLVLAALFVQPAGGSVHAQDSRSVPNCERQCRDNCTTRVGLCRESCTRVCSLEPLDPKIAIVQRKVQRQIGIVGDLTGVSKGADGGAECGPGACACTGAKSCFDMIVACDNAAGNTNTTPIINCVYDDNGLPENCSCILVK